MLINLNDAEVKFALHAVREAAAKLESKLTSETKPVPILDLLKANTTGPVRLTKAGRPAKKPGRKPGKKAIKQPEQQAA